MTFSFPPRRWIGHLLGPHRGRRIIGRGEIPSAVGPAGSLGVEAKGTAEQRDQPLRVEDSSASRHSSVGDLQNLQRPERVAACGIRPVLAEDGTAVGGGGSSPETLQALGPGSSIQAPISTWRS
jgi:hypothetical protein